MKLTLIIQQQILLLNISLQNNLDPDKNFDTCNNIQNFSSNLYNQNRKLQASSVNVLSNFLTKTKVKTFVRNCVCPNGEVFQLATETDNCGDLECVNGIFMDPITNSCISSETIIYGYKKVDCTDYKAYENEEVAEPQTVHFFITENELLLVRYGLITETLRVDLVSRLYSYTNLDIDNKSIKETRVYYKEIKIYSNRVVFSRLDDEPGTIYNLLSKIIFHNGII